MIHKVLVNLLDNDSNITAIVGDRIFPIKAPQETPFPFITYERLSNIPQDTKSGVSRLDVVTYTIDMWGRNPDELDDLGKKVRNALDRKSGTVDGETAQSIRFMGDRTPLQNFLPPENAYVMSHEYSVRHLNPTLT